MACLFPVPFTSPDSADRTLTTANSSLVTSHTSLLFLPPAICAPPESVPRSGLNNLPCQNVSFTAGLSRRPPRRRTRTPRSRAHRQSRDLARARLHPSRGGPTRDHDCRPSRPRAHHAPLEAAHHDHRFLDRRSRRPQQSRAQRQKLVGHPLGPQLRRL